MGQLSGKVAIVTGGSSGMGLASAIRLAREGAHVVIASRRDKEGADAVARVREAGGQAIYIRTDLTQAKDAEHLVEQTMAELGRLDIAVNNAGLFAGVRAFSELDEAEWRESIEGNVTCIYHAMRSQIPAMLKTGSGSIINISSVIGNTVSLGQTAAYSASKAAVVALSKSVAVEYAKAGVRVNALLPGAVDTPMFRATTGATAEGAAFIASLHAMGRIGRPEELADAVLFLASDASSFVTGIALVVDGGMSVL